MTALLKYWKPLVVTAILFLIVGATYYKGSHDKNQEWIIKDLERISQETKNILLASETARKKEREYADNLARIDQEGQDKLRRVNNEASNTIAALKRDNVSLRIAVKNNHSGTCSEEQASSLDNGETRAELSDEAFEFLAGEAIRADRAVAQLTACQKIIDLEQE